MNIFVDKIRNIISRNRQSAYILTVVVACIVTFAVVLKIMPEGQAGYEDKYSTAQTLSSDSTEKVIETGNTYIVNDISEGGMLLEVNKNSSGSNDVYIILEDVNVNLWDGCSALNFVYNDSSVSDMLNVYLIIKGENHLVGADGSDAPVIGAQNYQLYTEAYIPTPANASGPEDYVKKELHSNNVNLIIEEYDKTVGTNSLEIVTGAVSYGAGIGGAEYASIVGQDMLDRIINEQTTSDIVMIKGVTFYKKGKYLDVNNIKLGAAPVTIKSGKVDIIGNGYGAGIGNGGKKTGSSFSTKSYTDIHGNKRSAASLSVGQTSGAVVIKNGTISVDMNGNGSCFSNGSVNEAVAEDGRVTIDGGSIYLERQDNTSNYKKAYNSSGSFLCLHEAKFADDWTTYNNDITKTTFDLENPFDAEESYTYIFDGMPQGAVPYVTTHTELGGGNTYKFEGNVHTGTYGDKLYFYLPSTVLESYNVTIDDDFNRSFAKYGTCISNVVGTANNYKAPAGQGYTDYNGTISAKERNTVYLKISNIPKYCVGVKAECEISIEGVTQDTQTLVLYPGDNEGEYYAYVWVIGDTHISFDYEMGSYKINYHYGLNQIDINNGESDNIVNENASKVECTKGIDITDISKVYWEGRSFKGWYFDPELTRPVSGEIISNTPDEEIDVYAKWECKVTYKTEFGELSNDGEITLPYGSVHSVCGDTAPVISKLDSIVKFEGWINGNNIYEPDSETSVIVNKDMVFTAKFERAGYYIYITANIQGDKSNRDIADFVTSYKMVYSNNDTQNFNDIDGELYYRTTGFVNDEHLATLTIVPKSGYKIAERSFRDENGERVNLGTSTSSMNDFSFNMPEKDVYVTITFDIDNYSINYYDYVAGKLVQVEGGNNPSSYNIMDGEIVFKEPSYSIGRYYKFAGWKELFEEKLVEKISAADRTGDISLVATWEEVPVYDINIANMELGSVEAYVEGERVAAAAEGEKVTFKIIAEAGIKVESFEAFWNNPDGTINRQWAEFQSDNVGKTKEVVITMPAKAVSANAVFVTEQYMITYVNTLGAHNLNPTSYNVLDEIELTPISKEGYVFEGWKLVLPDTDTIGDVMDVGMKDITEISGMTGNLMLFADWDNDEPDDEDEEIGYLFYANNVTSDKNGTISLNKEEAYGNDCVYVTVSCAEGYRLKSLTYKKAASDIVSRFAMADSVEVDITMNEIAEDVYYFIMPEYDVDISAVFEPEVYTVTFDSDGGTFSNPATYITTDTFTLNDASRKGYQFLGWYDEEDELVTVLTGRTGDVLLTAKWEAVESDTTDEEEPDDAENETTGKNEKETTKKSEKETTKKHNNQEKETTKKASTVKVEKETTKHRENIEETTTHMTNRNDGTVSGETSDNNIWNAVKPPTDKHNSYVTSGVAQTGDTTDVMRLIVICVVCAVLLILIMPKKKEEEN